MKINKILLFVLFPIILFVGIFILIKYRASKAGRNSSSLLDVAAAAAEAVTGTVPSGGNSGATLGDRLNNPGCIRYNVANDWKGQLGEEKGFCKFDTKVHGLRAIMKILRTYINTGTNTISAIMHRYAPSHENNTEAYIQYVANQMGLSDGNVAVEWRQQTIMNLARAISQYESRYTPSDDELLRAWSLAQ